ncbi:phosphotransferase [Goodfellowiella coeruleoviolacea]|nr:phosphotransferase [Goodfellowiella coeruleoviolacea]
MDLRREPIAPYLDRAEQALGVQLDRTSPLVKRRTIGCRSDRDTWVRLQRWAGERTNGLGITGVREAAALRGVACPAWLRGTEWVDEDDPAVTWTVDETEPVTSPAVKLGGVLREDPGLSDEWWATLVRSFTALASQCTSRMAVRQEQVTAAVTRLWPDIDAAVTEWTPAHADMAWANVTAPDCWILDWEDWGMAPRGYDAACLWVHSLAVPGLAERVHAEFQRDLDTRSGRVSMLYVAARILAISDPVYVDNLHAPAKRWCEPIAASLRA